MRVNHVKLLVGGVQLRDGVTTVTDILGKIFTRAGLFAVAMEKGYASTIYGAHQFDPMLVTEEPPVSYGDPEVDVLVALDYDSNPDAPEQPNRDTVLRHGGKLRDGGVLVYDSSTGEIPTGALEARGIQVFPIPARRIAQSELKREIVKNVVMTGALFRLLQFDSDEAYLRQLLEERFLRKGREVVDLNLQAARRGRQEVERVLEANGYQLPVRLEPRPGRHRAVYISGNECLGLGAIAGGVRFYAGYPITPASSILEFMEQWLPKYGGRALQGQNERESIRAALGAALAGVRSMVGSSGPGISLKVEEFGVSGATETPVIVVDAQRAGPSTGMPTRPEQGDLNLVIGGGHGDFPRIVLAPGTVEECYTLMLEACELSDKYQCPVFFLTDLNLSEGKKTVLEDVFRRPQVVRHGIVREEDLRAKPYRRFEVTPSGISPRSVPGTPGAIFKASGAEHDEFGFVSIDPRKRAAMVEKRMRKLDTYLQEDWKPPQVFGSVRGNPVVVGWGNTRPVLEEARLFLQRRGVPVALVHFTHVFPLHRRKLEALFADAGPVVVVEQNFSGQFADLLQRELRIATRRVNKYNGVPLYPTEVAEAVLQALQREGAVVRIGGDSQPVPVEVGRNEHEGD
ncbi:MAG: 2-oxoacid:acceptor oxidoreductase subunit alpha [Armatimonadota bacterium]|nr:2-oxoacid:acceptor oxidoreductase subunit alpha [Armatimonadota bacterium]MDR5689195.1 2-oxoacid:acceptor oxidoreductase subunit alpha [Armatimonadota bacterium]MDR7598749.1 2-oxoacid:acceptor oxidoreductase subunit alpha [Armatimonadota bacterium]